MEKQYDLVVIGTGRRQRWRRPAVPPGGQWPSLTRARSAAPVPYVGVIPKRCWCVLLRSLMPSIAWPARGSAHPTLPLTGPSSCTSNVRILIRRPPSLRNSLPRWVFDATATGRVVLGQRRWPWGRTVWSGGTCWWPSRGAAGHFALSSRGGTSHPE